MRKTVRARRGRGVAPALLALVAFGWTAAPPVAVADSAAAYFGGGTAVVKEAGQSPAADKGAVACYGSAAGIGGVCLPFPEAQAGMIHVNDLHSGPQVAFQVCVDNDGDGVCRSPDQNPNELCRDYVAFSHDDLGFFINPLGPLPTSRPPSCANPSQGFNGYVVFLCEGIHVGTPRDPFPAHSHPATSGTVTASGVDFPPVPQGSFGNFCGGTKENVVEKNYVPLLT